MKVEQFLNRNQFHLWGEGKDILQSYDSKVVEISHNQNTGEQIITLGRDWDYSTTTSKHVYAFLEDYAYLQDTNGEFIRIKIREVSNKRAYVRKLIEEGTLKYNEEMH